MGKSRATSEDDIGSGKESKRKKIDKDERAKEIQNTSDILKNIQEQIEIKQLRLRKQKSLNDFSKCEKIVGEIGKLMNERKVLEKQLKHMEKKEAKSKWYYSKRGSEKSKSGESKQKGKRKSFDIAKMLKKGSTSTSTSGSTSTSTSESNESFELVLSSDEVEDEHTSPTSVVSQRLIFENLFSQQEETANQSPDLFCQQEETGNQSQDLFCQQEETGSQSPDLFSQQEETGNQSPDLFSQQEEAGNQSPDLFSQQQETGNQSPDKLSQQEETGNQSPDMLSQQVIRESWRPVKKHVQFQSDECNDIQKQVGTRDEDFA